MEQYITDEEANGHNAFCTGAPIWEEARAAIPFLCGSPAGHHLYGASLHPASASE